MNRPVLKFALLGKISYFCAGFLINFESICLHMVEKFSKKGAKKSCFHNRMEFRKRSNVELFWENGSPKRSTCFCEGLRSGHDRFWNEEGTLVDEGFYEKGLPVGLHRRWNGQGLLIEEKKYVDPKRYSFQYWDEKGTLRMQMEWVSETSCIEKYWNVDQTHVQTREATWNGKELIWKQEPLLFIEEDTGKSQEGGLVHWQERFPKLFFLSSSWTPKAPSVEEKLPVFDLGNSEIVFVYGLGNGSVFGQFRKWLSENSTRKLVFLEDDLGIIAHFFTHSPWTVIYDHPQVFLEFIDEENTIQTIAQAYPVEHLKMVSLPSRRGALCDSYELALLRQNTLAFALRQDRLHGYHPFSHFVRNIQKLPYSFYANAMKGCFQGKTAIICGAGPSLQEAIPWLKEMASSALIIAGGSTLAALSSQGVPIHFGMAIDPNLEEYRRFKNNFAFHTPILFSTRVHPGIFQTCNGPFGYMRSGIGGVAEIWMEEELNLFEPLIGESLSMEALSVTTMCVAFAQFLGCSRVVFSGVDLSYADQKRYASGVIEEEKESFSLHASSPDTIVTRLDHEGKPIQTAIRWVMEGASLSAFAKAHPEISFYNTTKQGLPMDGISYVEREKIFSLPWDVEAQVAIAIEKAKIFGDKKALIQERLQQLQESLERLIMCLEVLTGGRKGSLALAEVEIEEELAYELLFYDIYELFPRGEGWRQWLTLAQKYQAAFV